MWDMNNRTTKEQARINRDISNGKSIGVETASSSNDDNDVNISMASSRMVYDAT